MNYIPPLKLDFSLKHLQLSLMRIDLLIHRQVRQMQKAQQADSSPLMGQFISDSEVNALLRQTFGMDWRSALVAENGNSTAAYEKAIRQSEAELERLLQTAPNGELPRLLYLQQTFGLSNFELDALLLTIAPALDLRYERLFGYLLDDATRKRPSVNLILTLLCDAGPTRLLMLPYFDDEAPLLKQAFVELVAEPGSVRPPLLNQALVPDPALVSWLLGAYRPQLELGQQAELTAVQDVDADLLMAAERLRGLMKATAEAPIIAFHGRDEEAKKAAARLLAYQLERPLLTVNLATLIKEAELPAERAIRLALRDATLAQALLYLDGWDSCLLPNHDAPPTKLLELLCAYPDFILVASKKNWRPRELSRQRRMLWLDFPVPVYSERRALWTQFINNSTENELDLDKLSSQFVLTSSQIRDVVATAKDIAVQNGRSLQSIDLFQAARDHSSSGLAALARKISPRYDWPDLVLPADQVEILREIIRTVLNRPFVLEEWGLGKKLTASAGITVLFAGPPGTGKTMAAEVIAGELGLDLYKIDLSSVISKYIGETEKNLEKIFNEAESSNAVLFFDEADSIFGKRSEVRDAHDRYANIEVSYLLQRMEAYDGVTILATNLRANLDEAFMRRLQFAIDFPFPEKPDRLRIWKTLMPDAVPQAESLDLERMAHSFKLAGGNIRNIIVAATFVAAANGRKLTMEHLMHGARRELQKMGRLVNEDDFVVEE